MSETENKVVYVGRVKSGEENVDIFAIPYGNGQYFPLYKRPDESNPLERFSIPNENDEFVIPVIDGKAQPVIRAGELVVYGHSLNSDASSGYTFKLPFDNSDSAFKLFENLESSTSTNEVVMADESIRKQVIEAIQRGLTSNAEVGETIISHAGRGKSGKQQLEADTITFTTADEEISLKGFRQRIDLSKSGAGLSDQHISMVEAKDTGILASVMRDNKIVALFVENQEKNGITLMLSKEYETELQRANNGRIDLGKSIEGNDEFVCFPVQKFQIDANGELNFTSPQFKSATSDASWIFSAFGTRLRDANENVSSLRNTEKPFDFAITDTGFERMIAEENGCKIERTDPLYSQWLIMATNLERQKASESKTPSPVMPAVLIKGKNPDENVILRSFPITTESQKHHLNFRFENGKTFVYLQLENQNANGKTALMNAPQYYEVKGLSFTANLKELGNEDSEASKIHMELANGNKKQNIQVDIPINFKENFYAIQAMHGQSQIVDLLNATANLSNSKDSGSQKYTISPDKKRSLQITVYNNAAQTSATVSSFGDGEDSAVALLRGTESEVIAAAPFDVDPNPIPENHLEREPEIHDDNKNSGTPPTPSEEDPPSPPAPDKPAAKFKPNATVRRTLLLTGFLLTGLSVLVPFLAIFAALAFVSAIGYEVGAFDKLNGKPNSKSNLKGKIKALEKENFLTNKKRLAKAQQLDNLKKEIAEIENDKNLTPEQKAAKIKACNEKIAKVNADIVNLSKEMETRTLEIQQTQDMLNGKAQKTAPEKQDEAKEVPENSHENETNLEEQQKHQQEEQETEQKGQAEQEAEEAQKQEQERIAEEQKRDQERIAEEERKKRLRTGGMNK